MKAIEATERAVAACKLYAEAAQFLPHDKRDLLVLLDENRHAAVKAALAEVKPILDARKATK